MTTRVRMAILLTCCIALGFGLLALSSLLPAQPIARNIGTDAYVLLDEPRERTWMGVEHLTDPYTDALIMNTTMIDREDPVASTLAGRNYASSAGDARRSLVSRANNGLASNDTYARFWHGYVAPLRAVFSVLTYTQWRAVNTVLVWLGVAVLVATAYRRLGRLSAAVVLLVSLLAAPPVVGESLQFSPAVHLALWASIVGLALIRDREARAFDIQLFVVVGAATAFFDLFTAPLLTLGLPLTLLLAYRVSQRTLASEPTGLTKWELTGRATGSWLLGYVGMWAAKWLYVVLAIDQSSMSDVAGSATSWLGPGVGFVERWTAMATNFQYLVPAAWWPEEVAGSVAPLIALVTVGSVIAAWIALSRTVGTKRGSVPQALPLAAVAVAPLVWLMVAVRHAADMAFMEYRGLLVTVAATVFFFMHTIDWAPVNGVLSRGVSAGAEVDGEQVAGAANDVQPISGATSESEGSE